MRDDDNKLAAGSQDAPPVAKGGYGVNQVLKAMAAENVVEHAVGNAFHEGRIPVPKNFIPPFNLVGDWLIATANIQTKILSVL